MGTTTASVTRQLAPHRGALMRRPHPEASPLVLPRLASEPRATPAATMADYEVACALRTRGPHWHGPESPPGRPPASWEPSAPLELPPVPAPHMTSTFREGFWAPHSFDRSIWRGGRVEGELLSKKEDDREFAHFRRSTQMEWGMRQRRLAQETNRRRQQRRLRAARQRRQEQLPAGAEPAACEGGAEPQASSADEFGCLVLDAFGVGCAGEDSKPLSDPRQPSAGSAGSQRAGPRPEGDGCSSGRLSATRRSTVFDSLKLKTERHERMSFLGKTRRKKERFQRLLDARRRDFERKPTQEQEALKQAFRDADSDGSGSLDHDELMKACKALGLAAKTDLEAKEFNSICQEVAILGDVDFMAFVFEAVPRLRESLCEMRRTHLRQRFSAYDLDGSGSLSEDECTAVLERLCTGNLDAQGLAELRAALRDVVASVWDPETREVGFEGFEVVAARVQEHHQRIVRERESSIVDSHGLSRKEVSAHREELVYLHESFLRANTDGTGWIGKRDLLRLLIEHSLYPDDAETLQSMQTCVEGFGKHGMMNFRGFLMLARCMRESHRRRAVPERRRLFERFDRDRSGLLDLREVFALVGCMGLSPKCREDQCDMQQLLACVDADGSGEFDFEEFEVLVQRLDWRIKVLQRIHERDVAVKLGFQETEVLVLREAFFVLDSSSQGALGIETLRDMASRLSLPLSNQALDEAFEAFDPEGHGALDFVGFTRFLLEVGVEFPRLQSVIVEPRASGGPPHAKY
mmetsp:Transcript_105296/g.298024  ORF Transcript_105296/g.298024 Transcript_105296/m.298024 type:complete len:750 (+) Transcript_105296:1-2250(+)